MYFPLLCFVYIFPRPQSSCWPIKPILKRSWPRFFFKYFNSYLFFCLLELLPALLSLVSIIESTLLPAAAAVHSCRLVFLVCSVVSFLMVQTSCPFISRPISQLFIHPQMPLSIFVACRQSLCSSSFSPSFEKSQQSRWWWWLIYCFLGGPSVDFTLCWPFCWSFFSTKLSLVLLL